MNRFAQGAWWLTSDAGKNFFDVPVPTFKGLMKQHAVAPFFVFQMFCVVLWCLDEYWYYAVFTAIMLVVFEATVCYSRLRSLQELRGMIAAPVEMQVFQIVSSPLGNVLMSYPKHC